MGARREIAARREGYAPHGSFSNPLPPTIIFSAASPTLRGASPTRAPGTPRFAFGVRVGSVRAKKYRVTAYGSMARFCDIYLRTGQRIRVEGAYLRRVPLYEGLVRADTIRHVGSTILPYPGTLVRFVPARPPIAPVAATARPVSHVKAADDATLRTIQRDALPVS